MTNNLQLNCVVSKMNSL